MGILNITPDSFSDGGVHFDQSKAIDAALRMEQDGAAIIDVGGESTRPGADAVAAQVEIDRVVPVIEQIRRRSSVPISIDTRKAAVAAAALDAGANIVNDVSAHASRSPECGPWPRQRGVPVILMHMRGEPPRCRRITDYDDVVERRSSRASSRGATKPLPLASIAKKILVDPGIGFGKTFDHNLELLARCERADAHSRRS